MDLSKKYFVPIRATKPGIFVFSIFSKPVWDRIAQERERAKERKTESIERLSNESARKHSRVRNVHRSRRFFPSIATAEVDHSRHAKSIVLEKYARRRAMPIAQRPRELRLAQREKPSWKGRRVDVDEWPWKRIARHLPPMCTYIRLRAACTCAPSSFGEYYSLPRHGAHARTVTRPCYYWTTWTLIYESNSRYIYIGCS